MLDSFLVLCLPHNFCINLKDKHFDASKRQFIFSVLIGTHKKQQINEITFTVQFR